MQQMSDVMKQSLLQQQSSSAALRLNMLRVVNGAARERSGGVNGAACERSAVHIKIFHAYKIFHYQKRM